MLKKNSELLNDALTGLMAPEKSLDPKWLYDNVGSALFEDITTLPEYYLTRTETAILREHADRLAGLVPTGGALVEFGSGASVKTRVLLDNGPQIGTYVPIDISADFLQATAEDLRKRYPELNVEPVVGDFLHTVRLPDHLANVPKVGFFPGSTIGNIDPDAAKTLLARARDWPAVETFVLGVDLVKDPEVLVSAYDDAAGVTAQFISNILVRLNRELDADFDLSKFNYNAIWNSEHARIEMSLISSCEQVASLGEQDIHFQKNEVVSISMSRKYTADTVAEIARQSGWSVEKMITDDDALFAVAVLRAM